MALTDAAIKNTKPGAKAFKLADEKGLFLLIHPNGSRYWRMKYRIDGKEKMLALGVYPETSLKQARSDRDEARQLIANGTDPVELRKEEKQSRIEEREAQAEAKKITALIESGEALPGSFEEVALEWFAKQESGWADSHSSKIINRLRADVFPYMGRTPVAEVTAPEVLRVLERIESRGTTDTAHRAKQNIGQIMRFAIATGRAKYDPVPSLRGALTPNKKNHFAAVTEPAQIAPLLRIMAGYRGSPITRAALTIAPLVFVRPGELRYMEWADIDFETAEWRYTASKTEQDHIVPLSRQVIEALREIEPLTGAGHYVFPGARSDTRPMSENTVQRRFEAFGH
jgi:integrase